MSTRKYVIGSGWYASRERFLSCGNRYSRTVEFHDRLWKPALLGSSNPAAVVITVSPGRAGPTPDPREIQVPLDANYQNIDATFSGWGRSFLVGAVYAWCCMADYFYVEQDCLVFGDWVEQTYTASDQHPGCFLAGEPYSRCQWGLEMCVVFVPRHLILDLVRAFPYGPLEKERDEWQLAACGVPLEFLPYGPGRDRPIDWSASAIRAQHWTDEETFQAAEALGVINSVKQDFSAPDSWGD